jgi:hypothetical protein
MPARGGLNPPRRVSLKGQTRCKRCGRLTSKNNLRDSPLGPVGKECLSLAVQEAYRALIDAARQAAADKPDEQV